MVSIPLGSSGTAGRSEVVGTGTSPTVAEPTAAQNYAVLFAFAISDVGGAVTPPAGWTTLYKGSTTSVAYNAAWIRRGETAPSLTWGLTGSVYREVYIVCLTADGGLITINGLASAGATGNANTATHTPNAPPVTTVAPTALALCVGFHFAGSITSAWACAGYTVQTTNTVTDDACLFSKSLAVAGIEDPPAWTTGSGATSGDYWDGATVAFTDVQTITPSYTSSPPVITKRIARQYLLGDD